MYGVQLKIERIDLLEITDKPLSGDTLPKVKGDEVYFVVTSMGSNDEKPRSDVVPNGENAEYFRIRKGDFKENVQLLNLELDNNEALGTIVNVAESDRISFVKLGKAILTLGKGVGEAIAAIIKKDIKLGAEAIQGIVQGSIDIYRAIKDTRHQSVGAFNLGVKNIDGRPEFDWEPGLTTQRLLVAYNQAVFIANGSGAKYFIKVTAQFDADTQLSSTSASLEAASISKLILTGSEQINGTGNGFDNVIVGNHSNNTLLGLSGNDLLNGGGGDDSLDGGEGSDSMFGGLDNDIYEVDNIADAVTEYTDEGIDTVNSSISYVLGENLENLNLTGSDEISGTGNSLDNVIVGNNANNMLYGLAGNDTLVGDVGNDWIDGGDGIDTVYLANEETSATANLSAGTLTYLDEANNLVTEQLLNIENVVGTQSDDVLVGNEVDNQLDGREGIDRLIGNAGNDTLNGGAGDDELAGGNGIDLIDGGEGIDIAVLADINADVITGSQVDVVADLTQDLVSYTVVGKAVQETILNIERLRGTALRDHLIGDEGNNRLAGEAGNDLLEGGAGDDWLTGGDGIDSLDGGDGFDLALFGDVKTGITVDLSADRITYTDVTNNVIIETIRNIEGVLGTQFDDELIGSEGNDRLDGRGGNDTLQGGNGDDYLIGGNGIDSLDGGNGFDTINLSEASSAIIADLNAGTITYVVAGTLVKESIHDIEAVIGTQFNDALIGDDKNNRLYTSGGNDTLTGGGGADVFGFSSLTGKGKVTDFTRSEGDKIQISARGFDPTLIGGILPEDLFAVGISASTAGHRVIYNPATGALFFDADGNGTLAAQVQFATLSSNLNLTNTDIGITV